MCREESIVTSSEKEKSIFRNLLVKSIDGQITPEEVGQFNALLSTYPDLEDYYVQCAQLQTALREIRVFNDFHIGDTSGYKDQALWNALADVEKDAPAVEIPVPEEPQILIQKVQRQKVVRKISKSSLITLCTAAAAVILIFVFAHFAPNATGIKVAVLSDSINAKWADMDIAMGKGKPVFTSREKLLLREGYAKLLFDNQAQVTLEGPAEFQILAEDKINIHYGRLYAIVPPEAIGFMVTTQTAKVIDLGTEFGIEVDILGDTSLHVMKGKTTLIAGEKSSKLSMDVIQGIAKKVSAVSQTVSDITCDERLFARDIDSANEMIWRGGERPSNKYLYWTAKSGNWSDGANWDTGAKPDGTQSIRLQKSDSSVCTSNTAEIPTTNRLIVSNGQTLNIENGGYMGCGWSRFGWSTVNMTGNGTWVLNNENMVIGYPIGDAGTCVWTMSDTSKIDITKDSADKEILCISEDDGVGILKLIGSGVTVNCNQLYVGYVRNPGFAPHATLEYVLDAGGASTIHVGYRLRLSEGAATSHLVLSATESLPQKDMVLIETKSNEKITGNGVFNTLNGGPAAEGTPITLGGNPYTLTYQYDANGDGCRNDIALVFKKGPLQ
jgi:hypothetical protein